MQWPRSLGEGVDRPSTSLATGHVGSCRDLWSLTLQLPLQVWQFSWQCSLPWILQLHPNHRPRVVNLRARIWQSNDIFISHEKQSMDQISNHSENRSVIAAVKERLFSSRIARCWTFSHKVKYPWNAFPMGSNQVFKAFIFLKWHIITYTTKTISPCLLQNNNNIKI